MPALVLKPGKYFYRAFGTGFTVSFCAAGSFCGFLQLSKQILGPDIQFCFYPIIFIAAFLGLMSPQWLVKFLTDLRDSYSPLSRPDPHHATMVMAGMILLLAAATTAFALATNLWSSLYQWLDQSFLFNAPARDIIKIFILAIMTGPAAFLGGVMLAVLYRLTLTIDLKDHANLQYERSLPMWLAAGFALGYALWNNLLDHYFTAAAQVWISQLIAVFAMLIMVGGTTYRKQRGFITSPVSTAQLSSIASSKWPGTLLVLTTSLLAGAALPLLRHLLELITKTSGVLELFDALSLIVITVGIYLAGKFCGEDVADTARRRLAFLAGLHLCWAALMLVALGTFNFAWQITPGKQTLTTLIWLLFLLVFAISGAALRLGKPLIQESSVSKSLGFSRWLGRILIGVALGWIIGTVALLPGYGSLAALSILVLLAILTGGLTMVCREHSGLRAQSIGLAAVVMLFLASVLVIPSLSKNWLQNPNLSGVMLCETSRGSWALGPLAEMNGLGTCHLRCLYQSNIETVRSCVLRNSLWTERIRTADQKGRILLLGINENAWPLIRPPSQESIDYILEPHLMRILARQKLLSVLPTGQSSVRFITPAKLGTSSQGNFYDVIWYQPESYIVQDEKPLSLHELFRLLSPDGVLLIQIDNTRTIPELSNRINPDFRERTIIFKPALSQIGTRQTMFIVICKSSEIHDELISNPDEICGLSGAIITNNSQSGQ